VWEHLPAERIDQWAGAAASTDTNHAGVDPAAALPPGAERDHRQVLLLARELVIAVEELHALGIVHGQLHAGNVFVRDGRVRLTHISPLLYTDEREDAVAVVRLLRDLLRQRGEEQTALAKMLAQA